MGTTTLIPVEEYLNTSYDPDVEYVDGVLVERNVGDWLHSLIQRNLIVAIARKYSNVYGLPELRSKTKETRYRLPDVCVLLTVPKTKYLLDAAYIAIEILSEDDSMSKLMEKLAEYEAKGIAHIWVIDPRLETLSVFRSGSLLQQTDSLTDGAGIELTRAEVFQR